MSLKRSLHQISKTHCTKVMKKKSVRFADETVSIDPPARTATENDTTEHADYNDDKELQWIETRELAAQLQERLFEAALTEGLSILLKDSYEHPHINVQEYLNAFAAYTGSYVNDSDTWRGLELRFEAGHREERLRIRSSHVHTVLEAAAAAVSCADQTWDAVARISRQSSAASKLFAMRMGRADARAAASIYDNNNSNCCSDEAKEIVLEHRQREEYRKMRSENSKLSITTDFPQSPPKITA